MSGTTKKRSSFASCLACRAQHCACDEIRPCNRCSRLGITCTEGVSRKAKNKQPHYQLDTPATNNTLLSVPYTDLEKELFLDRPEMHFQTTSFRPSPALAQSMLTTSFPPAHAVQNHSTNTGANASPPPASVTFTRTVQTAPASGNPVYYPTVYMQTFNVGTHPQLISMPDPSLGSTITPGDISLPGAPATFPITYQSSPSDSPTTISPEQAETASPTRSPEMHHSPQQIITQLPAHLPIPMPQLPQQFMQHTQSVQQTIQPQQHEQSPQQQQQKQQQSPSQQHSPAQSQEGMQLVVASQRKMEQLEKEVQDLKHELWMARQQRVSTVPFLTNVQPRNMAMSMWRLPEAELVDFSAGFHTMLGLSVYENVTFSGISPEELRNERTSLWSFFAREKPVLCGLLTRKPLITAKGERIIPQTVCSLFHYGNSTIMQCTFWLN